MIHKSPSATEVACSNMLDIYNLLNMAFKGLTKDKCPNNAGRMQIIQGLLGFYKTNINGAKLAYGTEGEIHSEYGLGRIRTRIQHNQAMVDSIVMHIHALPNNEELVQGITSFKEQSDAFYKAVDAFFFSPAVVCSKPKHKEDQQVIISGADSLEFSSIKLEEIY